MWDIKTKTKEKVTNKQHELLLIKKENNMFYKFHTSDALFYIYLY